MKPDFQRSLLTAALSLAVLVTPVLVAATPIGYMRCYQSRRTKKTPKLPLLSFNLQDEFTNGTSLVRGPRELCNPASVDGAFIPGADPTAHLTCYSTKKNPKVFSLSVQVTNPFGVQQLTLSKPFQLCEPSEKGILPASPTPSALAIDHYRCYKANFRNGFVFTAPTGVNLTDQFETETADIRQENRLTFCNPVSKDGSPILDPTTHLTCFRLIEPPSTVNRDVAIHNDLSANDQYLTARTTGASSRICLPSTMTVIASPSGAFLDESVLP